MLNYIDIIYIVIVNLISFYNTNVYNVYKLVEQTWLIDKTYRSVTYNKIHIIN